MSREFALLRRKWEGKYMCSENPDKRQEDLEEGECVQKAASSGMGRPERGLQRVSE